jgi:hypothetical protein
MTAQISIGIELKEWKMLSQHVIVRCQTRLCSPSMLAWNHFYYIEATKDLLRRIAIAPPGNLKRHRGSATAGP